MRSLLFPLLLIGTPAAAASFVVDTGADSASSACTEAADDCSLRGAMTRSNLTPAADTIEFAIPNTDSSFVAATAHWRIAVATALPPIEQEVLIDGYTQPGALANTLTPQAGGSNARLKIEVQPANPSDMLNGFEISLNFFSQPASVVRGLAINRFVSQVLFTGGSAHRLEGCFLGTDISGSQASLPGNSAQRFGVRIFGPGAYVIGGITPEARNLIGGLNYAISMFAAADGLRIEGNLIGTNAAGTAPLPIRENAISSSAPLTNARIGGIDPGARNLISNSAFQAIYLSSSGSADPYAGTRIEGNYFGTDITGRRPMGNGLSPAAPGQPQASLSLFGNACALAIGGTAPGQANLIAFGGAAGIHVGSCRGVSSPLNHFYGNRGIPIDLSASSNPDGATANDANDPDDGGNRLQNWPVATLPAGFLPAGGSNTDITVSVDTAPANATYPLTVDVYRADCGGGSAQLIGSSVIQAVDAQLPRTFAITSADTSNLLPLTLLTRDALGNTSEFAPMQGDAISAYGMEDVAAALPSGHCRG